MERKKSPKDTGISGITGKIVLVRHATEPVQSGENTIPYSWSIKNNGEKSFGELP